MEQATHEEPRLAESDGDIEACFAAIRQLRPHLLAADFVPQVRRQERQGYRLVSLRCGGRVAGVAGFRLAESLANGRFLYVDDLVTDEARRSTGVGERILRWMFQYARDNRCGAVVLDSGVQRFAAHRFYFRHGMEVRAHHFVIELSGR